MSYYRNLVPGQYQIGDIVMGKGTNIKVTAIEVNPEDINAQDYQVARTDETRFGIDSFKPTTIELTMNVLKNRLLPDWEGFKSNFWHSMPDLEDLRGTWRFDQGRKTWGQMEHLYICSLLDNKEKVIFGRPGQFKYNVNQEYNGGEIVEAIGEFRRADTVAYSAKEYVTEMFLDQEPVRIVRSNGDVDTWVSIIGYGPITNPVITIGDQQIRLGKSFAAGEAFEISSYPWQRRAVDSNRVNLAANLSGNTRFLDKIILPANRNTIVRWTSDEVNTFVPDLNNSSWQEDINKLNTRKVPNSFWTLHGRVVVGFDLFNPKFAENYLASGYFQNSSACIYFKNRFTSAEQYSEATLTETRGGRSALVIMSDGGMSNYAMLEVTTGIGNNYLKIRNGTSPTGYGTVRAQWQNNSLWKETDRVAIKSFNSGGIITYKGYLNDVEKCSWTDSGAVVNPGSNNRYSGYVFDMDGNLLSTGTGFRRLMAWDHKVVPVPTGKMYLLWRDAYSVI